MPVKFSIVIPVRNDGGILKRCLESIKASDYPADLIEVIVADGLSTDDTVAVAASFGAKIVPNVKRIVAPARNAGFGASTGEIVAFIDADCVLEKSWIKNSVKYFDDPSVGGVSGPTLAAPDITPFERAVEVIFNLSESAGITSHRRNITEVYETGDLPGCNAIFRRRALEKFMPIDEHFVAADDSWISFRVKEAGFRLLFAPDVTLWHYHRNPPYKFFVRMQRYGTGRLQAARLDKALVKPLHILLGLSIPMVMLFAAIFYSLHMFSLFIALAILKFIAIFTIGLARTGSLLVAADLIWAFILFSFGWSIGFMQELILPSGKKERL